MFKKLCFFLFAMGVSASYAMAGNDADRLECIGNCNEAFDNCLYNFPNSVAACARINKQCLQRCDQ